MPLHSLKIERFRLARRVVIDLAPGVNLFVGPNAQGKTTVVEAVGYLSTGRSFRTARDREVIQWGVEEEQGFAAIEGSFSSAGVEHTARVVVAPKQKSVWIDGKQVRSLSNLWGLLKAVIFVPSDLGLVQGGPMLRRTFVDVLAGQLDPSYLRVLSDARRALQSRNNLLRSRVPANDPQYAAFEAALAPAAARVLAVRGQLVAKLADRVAAPMEALANGSETLKLAYEAGLGSSAGLKWKDLPSYSESDLAGHLIEAWAAQRKGDIERGQTRDGPHRDDVRFEINGVDARTYASQGQTRSCVLALRLAELDLLAEANRQDPVLILDDILGELDLERSRRFLGLVAEKGVQTLITTTDATVVDNAMRIERVFEVASGETILRS